jgi:acylphosphatase
MERIHAIVQGRVQGVYYRAATRVHARQLGLKGWVRNCPDGNVEFVAEGEETQLAALIAWSHKGPPAARVSEVAIERQAATGEFAEFTIRY